MQIRNYIELKKTMLNQDKLPNTKNKLKQIWSKMNSWRRTAKLLKFKTEQTISYPNQDWNKSEFKPNWEQNQTKENKPKLNQIEVGQTKNLDQNSGLN